MLLANLQAKPAWFKALLLTVFCLFLGLLLQFRTHTLNPNDEAAWAKPYDHHKYIYIAEHPIGSFHIAPSSLRIGVPFLVKQLPFPILTGFRIQNFVFLVLTAVLLYYLLLAAGYLEVEALLGIVMFWSYGAATKLIFGGPYSPDPASFALTVAALYFLLKEQDLALALTLFVGAFVKETIVLVIPLVYTMRAQRLFDLRLLVRTSLIAIPPIAVLTGLHYWIPAYNDVQSYVAQMGPQLTEVHLGTATYSFMDALHRVSSFRLHEESPVNMFRELTFESVGLLWLLPLFALRSPSKSTTLAGSSNWILLLRFLPFLALTYLGWFVALNADRRFAYAFPFWIMLSINGARALADALKIDIVWFIPVFLLQYLLNLLQPLTNVLPADLALGMFLISLGLLFSFRERFAPAL